MWMNHLVVQRGIREGYSNISLTCGLCANVQNHKMHALQKKHLREFRQDRRQCEFNNVPRDGTDLDSSDFDDFDMPPLNEDDFHGFVGMPPPFCTEDDDHEGQNSESSAE